MDETPEPLDVVTEPPELLELELALALAPPEAPVPLLTTSIIADAGEPNIAEPVMLVSEISKLVPPAVLDTGTTTVLALASPSCQVTVPLVAT